MIDARMGLDVLEALARARQFLAPVLDIVDGRVGSDEPPAWSDVRGWSDFLLALDDASLARCESHGLAHLLESASGAPRSLVELARAARTITTVPAMQLDLGDARTSSDRRVPLRKQRQLDALLAAIAPMAEHAHRIVDVGAGHGHFARLAAARFGRDTLGLDRDEERVATATSLSAATRGARFLTFDASHAELSLDEGDLAIGLHACGELGDELVLAAARGGADVALVSCCLQKVRGESRAPLSRAGAGLTLRREALGLTNAAARTSGVETSMLAIMATRRVRHALHHLLRTRGVDVLPGAEMAGINRRQAHAGLATIARRALAMRGLAPATDAELDARASEAGAQFARIRRLSLPRAMLARAVEVALVLDRAAMLREAGHEVLVATVFDDDVSPRNLGLFASRTPERLLAVRAQLRVL